MAIFPGEAGLAGLLALRIMEVVVTTGAVRRAKLHSDRYHRQTNTQFSLHARCPSCRPTNSVEALKGKLRSTFSFYLTGLYVHRPLQVMPGLSEVPQ